MSELPTTQSSDVADQHAATNLESLCTFVGTAAAMFYWAEVRQNPGIRTYWDALHYIATCLSVGYANVFPVTTTGKTIASVVQMLGPALSSKALEGLSGEAPTPSSDPALLAKLDSILAELQRLNERLNAPR